jgi:hypothetical protein
LKEAHAYAQGKSAKGTKVHKIEIARRDVAAVRLNAGLTQA